MKKVVSIVLTIAMLCVLVSSVAGAETYIPEVTEKNPEILMDLDLLAVGNFVVGEQGIGYALGIKVNELGNQEEECITIVDVESGEIIDSVYLADIFNENGLELFGWTQRNDFCVGADGTLYAVICVSIVDNDVPGDDVPGDDVPGDDVPRGNIYLLTLTPEGESTLLALGVDTGCSISMKANGEIVLAYSEKIECRKTDGTLVWDIELDDYDLYFANETHTLGYMAIGDNNIGYVSLHNEEYEIPGMAYAVDLENGSFLWDKGVYIDGCCGGIWTQQSVDADGNLYIIGDQGYCFEDEPVTFFEEADFESPDAYAAYLADFPDGVTFPVGCEMMVPLYAIDENGQYLWYCSSELLGDYQYAVLPVGDKLYTFGQIYVETINGFVNGCIVRDIATGEELDRFRTEERVGEDAYETSVYVTADGQIVYSTYDGTMYVTSADGTLCDQYRIFNNIGIVPYKDGILALAPSEESWSLVWIDLGSPAAEGWSYTYGEGNKQKRYPESIQAAITEDSVTEGVANEVKVTVSDSIGNSIQADDGVVMKVSLYQGETKVKDIEMTSSDINNWNGTVGEDLEIGDYSIVVTISSPAFTFEDKLDFTVLAGQADDEPDDEPETADNMNLFTLVLVGMLGTAGMLLIKKRRA